jgi:hypothetical protein
MSMGKYTKLKCPRVSSLDLLTTSAIKTSKNFKKGYLTFVLYLYPDAVICPYATKQCMAGCLVNSGQGGMSEVVRSCRKRRTKLYHEHRTQFIDRIHADISKAVQYCAKHKYGCAIRLNGTSDILWERLIDLGQYPTVQFYDYTKVPMRYRRPTFNYDITFSRSESNWADCIEALEQGFNVAVVFRGRLPRTYMGYTVVNGDEHDARFLDPKGGYIIGLLEKKDTRKKKTQSIREYGIDTFIVDLS